MARDDVELGFADKDLPAGWRALRRKCGVDVIELMYLSHRFLGRLDAHRALPLTLLTPPASCKLKLWVPLQHGLLILQLLSNPP
ncbi:unnamed protein product [Prorocentrum cordatum]|uniref:Uncharacterized protein n=1 Tax=Prorocentrum cordatum TaxID=2364126 RepID=A0ABN9SRY5_9DINO|nr:unnamed protein product [Polarella glacialis]